MAETIVLDPTEVATARTQFDITPWVKSDGIDWGDGAVTAYMAQAQRGDVPVDYRIPNRTVTIPLSVRNVGGTSFLAARNLVQAKAAMFQQEGGWLKRVTSGGTAVFADVVNSTLRLGGGWGQAYKDYDVDASLVLECVPDFYEAEVDLGDNTTTSSHIIFTETGIRGNYPARCRIVVDDDQPIGRLGVMWAARARRYSSSAANGIYYPAAELTAMDSSIGTDWTSLYSTDRDSGTAPLGALIHQGTQRVWIGVTTTTAVDFRLVWDVGDMTLPEQNPPVACDWSSVGGTFMLDLGEVRLDAPPAGTHRWKGLIQAKADATTTVTLREMWVIPVDEGYGVLRASLSGDIGMAAYSARSAFTSESGVITGDSAAVGGVWVGAGDADDFSVAAGIATRTATSDTANTGRFVTLNVNLTDTVAQVDSTSSVADAAPKRSVVARYADTSNWFKADLYYVSAGIHTLEVKKRATAVTTTLGTVSVAGLPDTGNVTMRVMVLASGVWVVWVGPVGSNLRRVASGQDSALATGGALATGDPGIYDEQTSATACTRSYDNFASWAPPSGGDAVIYASQSLELRTEGMFREDSSGSAYGPVSNVVGDLPRLPPATIEARTCELFVNASRGDFDELPDATRTDDISVRAFYRPSWLTVPG